jgi:hypothetical protein
MKKPCSLFEGFMLGL